MLVCKDVFLARNSIPNSPKMFHYYMNVGMSAGIMHQVVGVLFRCYLFTLYQKKENQMRSGYGKRAGGDV